ncbi:MAG: L,D-transpeptidase family protein [Methylococcaceae bacterium]
MLKLIILLIGVCCMLIGMLLNSDRNGGGRFDAAPLIFLQKSTSQKWLRRSALRFLMFFCLTAPAQSLLAEEQTLLNESPVASAISGIINTKQHPYLTQSNFTNRKDDLEALYKMANFQLLWLGNANTEKNIAEVLNLLENASVNGLNTENYDAKTLAQKLQSTLSLQREAYKELALYDTAISLSLLRFLHDLHYGRVLPQGIHFNLKLREKKLLDLPVLIKTSLVQSAIQQLPAQVEPKLQQYQKLKSALANYRKLAAQSTHFTFNVTKSILPGDNIPQLQELREFLIASGDLAEEPFTDTDKSTRYTDKIVAGVKKFQQRHGLNADGVIGKGTAAAINEPLNQRVSQIELAMERLRWLPEFNSGPSIIVNIPAFQLWAFDDINTLNVDISNMKVVVGKALKNQTPVLMAEMSFIDFMPYWNVPYNIVKEEILPKLIQNPGYLVKENMEIVSKSGVAPLNESTISQLKQGTARIRQRPGKKNALGKVKFIFPNKDDVYLHDTPSSSLFSRSRRDFSHGCVRVANPEGLAEFALKNQWTKETIQTALNTPKNQRVILKKPIPVLFFYATAFFDHEKLVFYPDIYGHDSVLIEALKKTEDLSDQAIFAKPASTEIKQEAPAKPADSLRPMAMIY